MKNNNIVDLTLDLMSAFERFGKYKKTHQGLTPTQLGHIGTHIDIMDCKEIDLNRFISKAHLIDVSHIGNSEINLDDTKLKELAIEKGDSVNFRTDWLEKTFALDPITNYFENHPFLSYETIDFLLEKQVNFIGMDSPGARRGVEHFEVDKYCADHGVFILENVANLDRLSDKEPFTFYCFPAKICGSSGVTCRALAIQ